MGEAHWRLVTPCPPGVTNCVTGHWSAVTARLRPGARLGPGLHSEVPAPARYSHPTHEGHGDTGTRGQCDKTQVREGVSWHWRLESWSCMWPQRAGAGRRHGAALRGALGRARGHGRGQHADTCDHQSSMHFFWFRCHQTTQKGRNLDPTIWKYIPLPSGQLIFGAILVIKTIKIRMMAFNLLGPRFQTDPLEPSDPRISYCWFYHSMPI